MKRRVALMLIMLACGWPLHVGAADPGAAGSTPSPPEQSAPPAAAPVTGEKPRPVEPPKPVERPRPVVERPLPAPPPAVVTQPEVEPAPPPVPAEPPRPPEAATGGGFTVGCGLLAFAMLITGFAAGFAGRHFWSRRQLGGMTVRIGTWRGIP